MDTSKGGKLSAKDGVLKVGYSLKVDGDKDERAAAGISGEFFVDIPEALDEALKDNATAQILVKWIDMNKSLLPAVEKEI
jgi:hypothetical protein